MHAHRFGSRDGPWGWHASDGLEDGMGNILKIRGLIFRLKLRFTRRRRNAKLTFQKKRLIAGATILDHTSGDDDNGREGQRWPKKHRTDSPHDQLPLNHNTQALGPQNIGGTAVNALNVKSSIMGMAASEMNCVQIKAVGAAFAQRQILPNACICAILQELRSCQNRPPSPG